MNISELISDKSRHKQCLSQWYLYKHNLVSSLESKTKQNPTEKKANRKQANKHQGKQLIIFLVYMTTQSFDLSLGRGGRPDETDVAGGRRP